MSSASAAAAQGTEVNCPSFPVSAGPSASSESHREDTGLDKPPPPAA